MNMYMYMCIYVYMHVDIYLNFAHLCMYIRTHVCARVCVCSVIFPVRG